MAKTIYYTEEDIKQYATISDILQFSDLEVVGEEYDPDTNTIKFKCKHSFLIGICPDCGQISNKIHDYPKEREIYDAPIRGCYVKLVFNSMRLKCGFCKKPFTLSVEDVVPNCTYTYRLAEIISDPARKQDIMTLSRVYGIGYKTAESMIFKAIENREFIPYYQPQFCLKTNRIIGAEALMRWKKPNGDLVRPDLFIELAEQSHLIIPMGAHIFEQATTDCQQWQNHKALAGVKVAVNISSIQFSEQNILDLTQLTLEKTGLSPSLLELEITESAMLGDVSKVVAVLNDLKKLNIEIALDDFGTGYSSMAYLSQLNIDEQHQFVLAVFEVFKLRPFLEIGNYLIIVPLKTLNNATYFLPINLQR